MIYFKKRANNNLYLLVLKLKVAIGMAWTQSVAKKVGIVEIGRSLSCEIFLFKIFGGIEKKMYFCGNKDFFYDNIDYRVKKQQDVIAY